MDSEMRDHDNYMKRTNYGDEFSHRSLALAQVAEDENTPLEIQEQARFYQNLLELKPLQDELREKIMAGYT